MENSAECFLIYLDMLQGSDLQPFWLRRPAWGGGEEMVLREWRVSVCVHTVPFVQVVCTHVCHLHKWSGAHVSSWPPLLRPSSGPRPGNWRPLLQGLGDEDVNYIVYLRQTSYRQVGQRHQYNYSWFDSNQFTRLEGLTKWALQEHWEEVICNIEVLDFNRN